MQLKGRGRIGLGRAPDADASQSIGYVCEEL
jgi:hypothetical protein